MPKVSCLVKGCCLASCAFSLLTVFFLAAIHPPDHNVPAEEENVVYKSVGGQKLMLDVYRPQRQAAVGTRYPAVVLVHGGGWERGGKKDMAAFGARLALDGFVCFAVDYRLTTDRGNRFPTQLDDVQTAVRWIRAHADRFGIEPDHIGAFGHSAGAHLAALLGTTDTRDNSDPTLAAYSSRVQCVVDTSGPVDFTDPAHPPLSPLTMALVPKLFGTTREKAPALFLSASPARLVDHKTAPFLILHGTQDTLVPMQQAEHMADALRKAGIEVRLVKVEDQHLFEKRANLMLWVDETLAFLHKHL